MLLRLGALLSLLLERVSVHEDWLDDKDGLFDHGDSVCLFLGRETLELFL